MIQVFDTKITALRFYGLTNALLGEESKLDFDSNDSIAYIKWEFSIDFMTDGVRSIESSVSNIDCELNIYAYNNEMTDDEKEKLLLAGFTEDGVTLEKVFKISATSVSDDWSIETEFGADNYGYCRPDEVIIDFAEKKIYIG